MPEADFLARFLHKIEKIDPVSLQAHLRNLNDERDFFRNILDSIAEGVLVVSPDGKVEFINRGAKALLGISESLSCRLKPVRDLVGDSDLRDFLLDHLSPRSHVVQHEMELLLPHHFILSVSISPLTDRENKYRGSVLLLVNTTWPRERERQMTRLERIESLTSLAAGIAHEIGNPLNSIGIHLRLLQQELDGMPKGRRKRWKELVEIIRTETARLDGMVKNFLRATRRKPAELKEEDINEILEGAIKFLTPEMNASRVRCELKLCWDIPPFLMDREKMHQVFLNIIKNAVESMPKGGHLKISSSGKEKVCTLVFQDDGMGIPEGNLPHIFEAYYTTKEEGSGLGLVIVCNLVQEHGGRIEVKSRPGVGTTLRIFLPIRRERLQLAERAAKER